MHVSTPRRDEGVDIGVVDGAEPNAEGPVLSDSVTVVRDGGVPSSGPPGHLDPVIIVSINPSINALFDAFIDPDQLRDAIGSRNRSYTGLVAQPVEHEELTVPDGRSGCPINMTMELLGDRWSLIVLRDVMFGGRTRFRELLAHSLEGIASNVLASRLARLTDAGLLSRNAVPGHRQKIDYLLTEAAIELVPLIVELGAWGARWLPTAPELTIRARLLADGGPEMAQRFMDELRSIHLEHRPPPDDGVLAELGAAYQRAVEQT